MSEPDKNNASSTPVVQLAPERDFSHETWLSLLGLIHPTEFFMTVNSFPIWRRHLAWAKPDGKELRDILTLRFSSTLVILSLLLGSEMGVLFNANKTTTAMRDAMEAQAFGDIKYWIGVTIWMSACVTVVGIIATFSAWGMVASISAENAHCLLRSSIGQYVANLPAEFVVASLYLFFIWLVLFMLLMMKGFVSILLMLFAAYLFFIVVVPLSAFGRLIMHTGAMSSTKVLEPDVEKRLLPCGLHACLLIKAMHRKHTRTSAVSQYRTTSMMKALGHPTTAGSSENNTNYGSTGADQQSIPQIQLPRPSVLNTMPSRNLRSVVERALLLKHTHPEVFDNVEGEGNVPVDHATDTQAPGGRSVSISDHVEVFHTNHRPSHQLRHRRSSGVRNSLGNMIRGQLKRVSRNQVMQEWDEENAIRDVYNLPPPEELEEDDDEEDDDDDLENQFDTLYAANATTDPSHETQNLLPK